MACAHVSAAWQIYYPDQESGVVVLLYFLDRMSIYCHFTVSLELIWLVIASQAGLGKMSARLLWTFEARDLDNIW